MRGGVGPYMAGAHGLSEDHQEKLQTIERDNAREHWQLMQQMHQQQRELYQLYQRDEPDPAAVGKAYQRFSEGNFVAELPRPLSEEAEKILAEQ